MQACNHELHPLWSEGFEKEQREERIGEMIAAFHLDGLETRYPSEISGGQQQRVALARGVIRVRPAPFG